MIPHRHQSQRDTIPNCSGNTRLSRVALVIGLCLAGCISPTATPDLPTPTVVAVLSPIPTHTIGPTNTALPNTPTFESSPTPTPPTPEATSCGAPSGWKLYIVRPNDNLFRLGLKTQTTVEQIKLANCLTSDLIFAGNSLYLPFLPPIDTPAPQPPSTATLIPPPTFTETPLPPPPPPSATACPSVFSCQSAALPPLTLPAGGPNDPTFIPCQFPRPNPWIDTYSPFIMELGLRRYFFACDFPTSPAQAAVTLSDGTRVQVELLQAMPNPDWPTGRPQAVIDWPALPTQPTGVYTLTVASGGASQASLEFMVTLPTQEYILLVPAAGPPGTTFQVYYVNFAMNSTPTFEFYGEDQPVVDMPHVLSHRNRWQISITQLLPGTNDRGWAQAPLVSVASDRPAAYAISHDFNRVFNLIWLR